MVAKLQWLEEGPPEEVLLIGKLQRFGAAVALSGLWLRVEVWVISGW
jgi:hypothetical protein